jgi:dTDP-4-amino-4,6-dideoxygalactose transaminase
MIRFVDRAARHARHAEAIERRVLEVLRSGRYIGGPVVEAVEARMAQRMGRARAVGVGSGTDALMLALTAAGVRAGDEVVVPAISFFATAGAVGALGAVPVVADVTEDGLIDPASVDRAFSHRTRAVVPVHLFGSEAPALDVAVPVIDDACQAVGGRRVGAGWMAAVSVYPTKLWGAAGDGGFVVGDEGLDRVRALGYHGAVGVHVHDLVDGAFGRNSRLDALQAAVLLGLDEGLDDDLAARARHVAAYDAGLPRGMAPLDPTPGRLASPYVILTASRDLVMRRLAEAGVEASVYYPRSLAAQPALPRRPTPVADHLCARMLALPCHEGMSASDVARVLAVLHSC